MTWAIITDVENIPAEIKSWISTSPVVQTIETDAEAIGTSALNFIKTNGLQDLYQIALTLVSAAIPGASWATTLSSIEAQAVTDGKQLVTGATAVVAAQAQADLIAAGKLVAPLPASAA